MSYFLCWGLNFMVFGDEEVNFLGINVFGRRFVFIFILILMVVVVIFICGEIGWVGLIVFYMV